LRSNSAVRESQIRNSKFDRLVWPEPVELRDGFEAVCFDLIERLVCSEPAEWPELIEWAVALEAMAAMAAVELEAPDSRHSSQAVVEMAAGRASARSARGESVQSVEAQDELARFALFEKVQECGAGSGSMEVAR
jgi:hypothetical protein